MLQVRDWGERGRGVSEGEGDEICAYRSTYHRFHLLCPLEKFQEKTAALIAASNPNQFELWMQISAGKFPFGAAIFS